MVRDILVRGSLLFAVAAVLFLFLLPDTLAQAPPCPVFTIGSAGSFSFASHGGDLLAVPMAANTNNVVWARNNVLLIDGNPCWYANHTADTFWCHTSAVTTPVSTATMLTYEVRSVDPSVNCSTSLQISTTIYQTQQWFSFWNGPWWAGDGLQISGPRPRIPDVRFASDRGVTISMHMFSAGNPNNNTVAKYTLLEFGQMDASRNCSANMSGIHVYADGAGRVCFDALLVKNSNASDYQNCLTRCSSTPLFANSPLTAHVPDKFRWLLAAITDKTVRIYIDGVLRLYDKSMNDTRYRFAPGNVSATLGVQCSGGQGVFCPRQTVDHVAVFNSSISSFDVARLFAGSVLASNVTGLVGLYTFDEPLKRFANSITAPGALASIVCNNCTSVESQANVYGASFQASAGGDNGRVRWYTKFWMSPKASNVNNMQISTTQSQSSLDARTTVQSCQEYKDYGISSRLQTILQRDGTKYTVICDDMSSQNSPSTYVVLADDKRTRVEYGNPRNARVYRALRFDPSMFRACPSCTEQYVSYEPFNATMSVDTLAMFKSSSPSIYTNMTLDLSGLPLRVKADASGEFWKPMGNAGAFMSDVRAENRSFTVRVANTSAAYFMCNNASIPFCLQLDHLQSGGPFEYANRLVVGRFDSSENDQIRLALPADTFTVRFSVDKASPDGGSWQISVSRDIVTAVSFTNVLQDNDAMNPLNWQNSVLPGPSDRIVILPGQKLVFTSGNLTVDSVVQKGGAIIGAGPQGTFGNFKSVLRAKSFSITGGNILNMSLEVSPGGVLTFSQGGATLDPIMMMDVRVDVFDGNLKHQRPVDMVRVTARFSNSMMELIDIFSPKASNFTDLNFEFLGSAVGVFYTFRQTDQLVASLSVANGSTLLFPLISGENATRFSLANNGTTHFGQRSLPFYSFNYTLKSLNNNGGGGGGGGDDEGEDLFMFKFAEYGRVNALDDRGCIRGINSNDNNSPRTIAVRASPGSDGILMTLPFSVQRMNSTMAWQWYWGWGGSSQCPSTNSSSTGSVYIEGAIADFTSNGDWNSLPWYTLSTVGLGSAVEGNSFTATITIPEALMSCSTVFRIRVSTSGSPIAIGVAAMQLASNFSITPDSPVPKNCHKVLPSSLSNRGLIEVFGVGSTRFTSSFSPSPDGTFNGRYNFEPWATVSLECATVRSDICQYSILNGRFLSARRIAIAPGARLVIDGDVKVNEVIVAGQLFISNSAIVNKRFNASSVRTEGSWANLAVARIAASSNFDDGSLNGFTTVNIVSGAVLGGGLSVSSAATSTWNRYLSVKNDTGVTDVYLNLGSSYQSSCISTVHCVLAYDVMFDRPQNAPVMNNTFGDFVLSSKDFAMFYSNASQYAMGVGRWSSQIMRFRKPGAGSLKYGTAAPAVEGVVSSGMTPYVKAERFVGGVANYDNFFALESVSQIVNVSLRDLNGLWYDVRLTAPWSLQGVETFELHPLNTSFADVLPPVFLQSANRSGNDAFVYRVSFASVPAGLYLLGHRGFAGGAALAVGQIPIPVKLLNASAVPSSMIMQAVETNRSVRIFVQGYDPQPGTVYANGSIVCRFGFNQDSIGSWDDGAKCFVCTAPVYADGDLQNRSGIHLSVDAGSSFVVSAPFMLVPAVFASFEALSVDVDATRILLRFSADIVSPTSDCVGVLSNTSVLALGAPGSVTCSLFNSSTMRVNLGATGVTYSPLVAGFNLSLVSGGLKTLQNGYPAIIPSFVFVPFVPTALVVSLNTSSQIMRICDDFAANMVVLSGSLNRTVVLTWNLTNGTSSSAAFLSNTPLTLSSGSSLVLTAASLPPGYYTIRASVTNALGMTWSSTLLLSKNDTFAASAAISGPVPASIRRSSTLSLSVLLSAESCLSSAGMGLSYAWSVSPATGSSNISALAAKTIAEQGTSAVLQFPALSFASGFNYTVSLVIRPSTFSFLSLNRSFDFAVVSFPLVAVIDQGSIVEQGSLSPMVVSGSKSYDPDNDPATATYSWSCWRFNNETAASSLDLNAAESSCAELTGYMQNVSTFTVPAGTLVVPRAYVFRLSYAKGAKSSSAFLIVRARSGAPPVVRITEPSSKVSHSSKVSIVSEVSPVDPRMQYMWSFASGSPTFDLSNSSFILSSKTSATLVIAPFTMSPGLTYTFAVVVTDAGGLNSTAYRSVIVNAPPTGGSCSVSPLSGTELDTPFTLQCANYQDDDLPLFFDVYLVNRQYADAPVLSPAVFDPDRTSMILNQQSPTLSGILLPAGKGGNSTLTLLVVVRDYLGAYATSTVQVRVSAKSFVSVAAQTDFVTTLIATTLNNKIASNDSAAALQLVASLSLSAASNDTASSASKSAIVSSAPTGTADSSKCPASCNHGSCQLDGTVAFCKCSVGWAGPLCSLNSTELALRSQLNEKLLDSLARIDVSSIVTDATSATAVVRSKIDVLGQVASNPLEVSDKAATQIRTVFTAAVESMKTTGLDSSLFERMSTTLSSYVLAVGLGESSQHRKLFLDQGRNRSAEEDSRQSKIVTALLNDIVNSAAKTLAAGERASEASTDSFVVKVQRLDRSSATSGSFDISNAGSASLFSTGSNVTNPSMVLPSGFRPCSSSNDTTMHLASWLRNPYGYSVNVNDSARSLPITMSFSDFVNATECNVGNMSSTINFTLPVFNGSLGSTKKQECRFFNPLNSKWETTGVTTIDIVNAAGAIVGVKCLSTHLTTFVTFEAAKDAQPNVKVVDVTSTSQYNQDLLTSEVFFVLLGVFLIGWLFMIVGYVKDRRDRRAFLSSAVVTFYNASGTENDEEQPLHPLQKKDSSLQEVTTTPQPIGVLPPLPPRRRETSSAYAIPDNGPTNIPSPEDADARMRWYLADRQELEIGRWSEMFANDSSVPEVPPADGSSEIITVEQEGKWIQFKRKLPRRMVKEHSLLGLVFRDPHDLVTRPQRVMLLICLVLLTMAVNAFFSPNQDANFVAKLAIIVLSSWMSEPVVLVLSFMFRRVTVDQERRRRRKEKVLRDLAEEALRAEEEEERQQRMSNAAMTTDEETSMSQESGGESDHGQQRAASIAAVEGPMPGTMVVDSETTSPGDADVLPSSDMIAPLPPGGRRLLRGGSSHSSQHSNSSLALLAPNDSASNHGDATVEVERTIVDDPPQGLLARLRERRRRKQLADLQEGKPVYAPPKMTDSLIILLTMSAFSAIIIFWIVQAGAGPLEIGLFCGIMVIVTAVMWYLSVWRHRKRLDAAGIEEAARKQIQAEEDVYKDDGTQFLFPAWCIWIVYGFSALIQAFAAHVCILYAMDFGESEGRFWYISTAAGLGQEMLVVEPLVVMVQVVHEVFLSMVTGTAIEVLFAIFF